MAASLRDIDFSKPVYLHHMFQKFWEIRLDRISLCSSSINFKKQIATKL